MNVLYPDCHFCGSRARQSHLAVAVGNPRLTVSQTYLLTSSDCSDLVSEGRETAVNGRRVPNEC